MAKRRRKAPAKKRTRKAKRPTAKKRSSKRSTLKVKRKAGVRKSKRSATARPRSGKRPSVRAKRAQAQSKATRALKRGLGVGTSVDSLGLVDYVADAARLLLSVHPGLVITSGRRNTEQQAGAMAGNIVKNRNWITETYRASPERMSLQAWIDAHPTTVTKDAIAAGLVGVMSTWSDAQKGGFSRHFSGQAFDIRPVPDDGAITATIRALPNLRKFLEKEGGLTIWHADFEKA
jgi:hypothetical protein